MIVAPIKVVTDPSVYLVSRPETCLGEINRFLKDHNIQCWGIDPNISAGDALPELAGRLCYMSYGSPRPGGNEAYLKHILEVGHESVLEHSNFSFIITGVSRSLTHELVRHRHLSPSQLSQRYVDESDVSFVLPPALLPSYRTYEEFKKHPEVFLTHTQHLKRNQGCDKFMLWRDSCTMALSFYRQILGYLQVDAPEDLSKTEKIKWARQAARSVLPNCTETKIFLTGNMRAWRQTILLRASRHADTEIRKLFNMLYSELVQECPNGLSDFRTQSLPDGTYEVLKK